MRLLTKEMFEKTFATIGTGDDMLHYLYHSNVQCTGDTGFSQLLAPFHTALRPMRVAAGLDPTMQITLIYGMKSWIEPTLTERTTFVELIPAAGHQVYADQTRMFVDAVCRAVRRVE